MTAAPMDVRQWVDTDVSARFATEAAMWKALRICGESSFQNKKSCLEKCFGNNMPLKAKEDVAVTEITGVVHDYSPVL